MLLARDILQSPELRITGSQGDLDREIRSVAPLGRAAAGVLTFIGKKLPSEGMAELRSTLAGAVVICGDEAASGLGPESTALFSENPRLSFMRAVRGFFPEAAPPAGIHPTAVIDSSARVHPDASIGAFCVVGAECEVGPGTVLYPHVTLYPKVRIGANSRVNAGTVIGADGFGYERNEEGELEKFPHIGGVVIGDDVEIGSNTSIDRGSLGDTRIEDGARIDNQIHVAHNVVVGPRSAVIAQAMLGGSVKIGAGAWIAPAAVLMNQIKVGDGAVVGLGAVATKDVRDGQTVMGSPAQDEAEFKRNRAALRKIYDAG